MVDNSLNETFTKRKTHYTHGARYVYPATQEKSKDIDVAKIILKRNEVPMRARELPQIVQSKTKSISDEYHYHRDSSKVIKNPVINYTMDDSISVLPDPYYFKQSYDPTKSKSFFYYANKHIIGADTPDTRVSLNKEVLHETGKIINTDKVANIKSKNM